MNQLTASKKRKLISTLKAYRRKYLVGKKGDRLYIAPLKDETV